LPRQPPVTRFRLHLWGDHALFGSIAINSAIAQSRHRLWNAPMANTYTKLYVHVVFSVQNRLCLLAPRWRDEVFQYVSGIVRNRREKLLAINGTGDHVHIALGITPTIPISDLVRDIKAGSSAFINDKKWIQGRFQWQEGFGAFSFGAAELDGVVKYITNQEAHHRKRSFREEYVQILGEFNVAYEEKYLFTWIHDRKEE
jgi:putative transposase